MPSRALLIGSEIHGLLGVRGDVTVMAALLGARGFAVTRVIGADATRAGILAAYERLVEETAEGDIAVVYYAGHGAYLCNKRPAPGEPEILQCLVPTDWDEADDFRGIADYELSALLARLAKRSRNTTVILDCCHSAQLSRGLVARTIATEWTPAVSAFFAAHPPDRTLVSVVGNPDAVRMVAAEADRLAYERDFALDGATVRRGAFTRAFEQVLTESGGAPLTWRSVNDRVRELVVGWTGDQRPSAEGPIDRLLFSLEERRRGDAIVYFEQNGQPALRGSRVLGLRPGAVYDLMPPATLLDPAHVIATATVTSLEDSYARISLSGARPPIGALAYPREQRASLPVVLDASLPAELRATLEADSLLAVVAPGEPHVEVRCDATGLHAREAGRELFTAIGDDAAGRTFLVERLETLARSRRVHALVPAGIAAEAIALDYGRVVDGGRVAGAPLRVGDFVYVAVRNLSQQPLWIAIYDVGICGEVVLLNERNGTKIEPGREYVLGASFGELPGLGPLFWPAYVPADGPRRESFVVVFADHWVDFDVLETGGSRNIGAMRGDQRYGVRVIDFELSPAA